VAQARGSPTPRPYHHGNLRSALLAQAERTVREHGADELSLRELARQVGVSHSAPRRHFADRQALRSALAEAGFEHLGAELRAALDEADARRASAKDASGDHGAGSDDALAVRLLATARAYVRFATRDAALLELMFASKHETDSAELDLAAERSFSVILELIHQGQSSGVLRAGEPEHIGLLLFAMMHGIAALYTSGMLPPERLDELVSDAVEQFLRGQHPAGGALPGVDS
jgi:AcrR family transcriptional regulator